MSFLDSLSLILIMIALAAIPSSSVALVVARSATMGVSHGIAVSTGIVLGDLLFIALAILGLSTIADSMGAFFAVIRIVGSAYLLWIGYSLLIAKDKPCYTIPESKLNGKLFVSFLSGFVLTLGDVKAIFFYASLFPVFVDFTTLSLTDLLLIASITIVSVGGVKIAYALAAHKLVNLTQGTKLQGGARKVAGSFVIGAGSYLILKP